MCNVPKHFLLWRSSCAPKTYERAPYSLENLVTHRSKIFTLSRDCQYARPWVYAKLSTLKISLLNVQNCSFPLLPSSLIGILLQSDSATAVSSFAKCPRHFQGVRVKAKFPPWRVVDFSSKIFLAQSSLGKSLIYYVRNFYNGWFAVSRHQK